MYMYLLVLFVECSSILLVDHLCNSYYLLKDTVPMMIAT